MECRAPGRGTADPGGGNQGGSSKLRLAHRAPKRSLEGVSATEQGEWEEKQHFRDSCGGPGDGSEKLV